MTTNIRVLFSITCALAASFVGAGPAFAQGAGSATVTGAISDPSGSSVPGAAVVIRNTDTGIERRTETSDAGIFEAPFLPPGHYEVQASKAGFADVLRKELVLQVGQTLTVNLSMAVKAAQQVVTVTGEAPVVDAEKTEVSQVVSQGLVENLPIAGRRWDSFALLTPNVTNDGGSGLVSYRGISGLYNSNAVDGANNNQAFFSEARGRALSGAYVYSMDSIREYQVSSSNYSAELGQAAGGVVNAVTRSGANAVHGDLFYYLRYPTLNALDPISKSQGIYSQPIHQQQQFGASVGGPIVKDKLFYFFTYDGSRKVNPVTYTSSSKFPLTCPALVSATQCSAANGFLSAQVGQFPRATDQDLGFGKLDYQVSQANHVSAAFDLMDYKSPNGYSTNPSYNNLSVTANGANTTHERIFVTNWDSTITSSLVNNLRFQWGQDLEIAGANAPGPSVGIASVMTYGMPNALPRPAFPNEHRYQISDTLSAVHSRHTLKMGLDLNFIHELLVNLYQGGGLYNYTGSAQTAFNNWVLDMYGINTGDGLTGRHFASFAQVTDPITGIGKDDFYNNDVAGFFEDNWKVSSKLTLNLGVRYDLQSIPQPPKPNTATPLTSLYSSHINIDKNNLAPRVGLAWNLAKNTVLRAGYGMFYAKTSNSTYYAIRVENGVYQQTFNCTPATCPSLAFPNVIFPAPGPALAAPFQGALTPQVTTFAPPAATQLTHGLVTDFVNPMVHEGDVTFERQLPGNNSVSVAYVFSRGMHLPMFIDTNLQPSTITHSYDVVDTSGNTVRTVSYPFYTKRVDPTGVVLSGFSDVNSWYNSMVVTFRRPVSHGLEFLANYTLSRATDGGEVPGQYGTFYGTDYPIDPMNRKIEYATSDLNQHHRFVGSAVWMPRLAGLSSAPARVLVNGWNFSTIVTIASGQPVTAYDSGFAPGGPDGGLTGGTVSNSGGATSGRSPWIPRNAYTLPAIHNMDFRVGREFGVTERLKLQFIGEAFNLFNTTNITAENTTAFNYTKAGAAGCAGHTNACLVPNAAFLRPTAASTFIYTSRQLQLSARLTF